MLALGAVVGGSAAFSAEPKLALPLNCVPGETCWVVNRVDVDPGPKAVDHTCDDHTYDDHKGFDIAIAGGGAMRRGVEVLAAAPGRVVGTRDEMPDIDVSIAGRASVTGRECGNGVIIQTDEGWRHQYCHMRRGSVTPHNGMRVEKGDMLGYVGMSGLAQFPHLHLQVSRNGVFFDPDTGFAMGEVFCGTEGVPMWDEATQAALSANTSAIHISGFAPNVPKPDDARDGAYDFAIIAPSAPALLVWFDVYRPDLGDRLTVKITAPDGQTLVHKTILVKKEQARRFMYVGAKRKALVWPPGRYEATINLVRAHNRGEQDIHLATTIEPSS